METHTPQRERLIDTQEVAARYGIHPRTVVKFFKSKRIPSPVKCQFGQGLRWRESDINRHIAELDILPEVA